MLHDTSGSGSGARPPRVGACPSGPTVRAAILGLEANCVTTACDHSRGDHHHIRADEHHSHACGGAEIRLRSDPGTSVAL
jgi:hypothetical protein